MVGWGHMLVLGRLAGKVESKPAARFPYHAAAAAAHQYICFIRMREGTAEAAGKQHGCTAALNNSSHLRAASFNSIPPTQTCTANQSIDHTHTRTQHVNLYVRTWKRRLWWVEGWSCGCVCVQVGHHLGPAAATMSLCSLVTGH